MYAPPAVTTYGPERRVRTTVPPTTAFRPQSHISKFRGMRITAGLSLLALVVASCAPAPASSGAPSSAPAGNPSATPAATPSAVPTASKPDASTASPLTIAWEPSEPFGGQVNDVYADGDTWIAGGFDEVDGPAAWTATDATTWVRSDVENQQPDEMFRGPRLGPMTRLGDSLLSFGTFIGCCDSRGVYGWRSLDGASWTAIESASPLFADGYLVQEVAAGDRALVALESQFAQSTPGGSGPGPRRPAGSRRRPGHRATRHPASSRSMLSGRTAASSRSGPAAIPGSASRRPPRRGCRPTGEPGKSRRPATPTSGSSSRFRRPAACGRLCGGLARGMQVPRGRRRTIRSGGFHLAGRLSLDCRHRAAGRREYGAFTDLVVVSGGLVALNGQNAWTTRDGITGPMLTRWTAGS